MNNGHEGYMTDLSQRVDRTTRNRDEAKLRTAKKREVWEAIDKEKDLDRGLTSVQASTTTTEGKEA